jgi:hypothetical protein
MALCSYNNDISTTFVDEIIVPYLNISYPTKITNTLTVDSLVVNNKLDHISATTAQVDTFKFNDTVKIFYQDTGIDEIFFQSGSGQSHLNFKKSNLYGVLPPDSAAITVTTATDTYYFIQGNFVNQYSVDFGADVDTILYTGTAKRLFDGTLKASIESGTVNTLAEFGLFVNDTLCLGCGSGVVELPSADVDKSVTIPFQIELSPGDKIKLMVKSN